MKDNTLAKPGILLVANWDSNAGYAWWLIESYWTVIHKLYSETHQVYLCYPSISTVPRNIVNSGIDIRKLNFSPTSGPLLKQCQFIHENNIKCIYFSDQPVLNIRYALFRTLGVKKVIIHDHTPGIRTEPGPIKKVIKNIFSRLPLVTMDGYIGATPFVQQRGIDVTRIPKEKTFNVKNGIPLRKNTKNENINQLFGIPTNRQIMVSTGRAHQYKGIPFVLECMSEIINNRNRTDLHFLFCGNGPHLNYFKQLVRELSLEEYVSLPGHLENIAGVVAACDFSIHPSSGEVGYSLSILEYMYASLPVIVPNNPSVSGATINGKTGLIYQTNNMESACTSILELLNNPEKCKVMGKEAYATIISSYTLDETHNALDTVINNIYPAKSIPYSLR